PLQEQTDHHHPVVSATFERGAMRIRLRLRASARRKLGRSSLMLALESATQGSIRWRLPLPGVSGVVPIQDSVTGGIVRQAAVRIEGGNVEVAAPIASLQPLQHVFLKFQRPVFLKDEAGWREAPALPIPVQFDVPGDREIPARTIRHLSG